MIPTHVHLDHAGGVGLLMEALPGARALVHPRGLRHLVDPKALWLGALAVYGEEEMLRSYGKLVPVPAERVTETREGMQVLHQAGHDFFQPRVAGVGKAGDHGLGDVVLVEVAHGLFAVGSVELR